MIVAAKCVPVTSSWVRQFILTCDNELAVEFRNGVCCLYPNTNAALFNVAISWPSPGKFVHQFLYKILPYTLIKCPCPAQPCPSGTVPTACCPHFSVPTSLHATLTGAGALDGTYALTYDPVPSEPSWRSPPAFTCVGIPYGILFECSSAASWNALVGDTGATYPATAGSTCTPFVQRFGPIDLTHCGGTAGATLTVTT